MKQQSLLAKIVRTIKDKGLAHTAIKIIRHPIIRHPFSFASSVIAKRKLRRVIGVSSSVEERFTNIFAAKYWGDEESVSGPGSRLAATENLRRMLPELIDKFSIKSIFDAPCGDFYWMRFVLSKVDVKYIGGDIVKELIEKNLDHQSSKVTFIHFDIITNQFPQADLWICRDCLLHLSFDDTFQALQRFIESDIPYLLATTYKNVDGFENRDIDTGDGRKIDLFAKPYCFDENVLFRIDDYIEPWAPREMCLWSREQILHSIGVRSSHNAERKNIVG